MSQITLIGLDLAKNIFRINCLDEKGKRIANKNISRDRIVRFFANLPPCVVAMEACASSHYWGRKLESLGHKVLLIHPLYVSPYRLGDKNDANDAAAICAAAQRSDMRFVRLRTQQQSDMQALHRVREGMVADKTETINRIRSLLAENGIVIKQGPAAVFSQLPGILDDIDNELSDLLRQLLRNQYVHLLEIHKQITETEKMLKSCAEECDNYKHLMAIPGIGLITATLLGSEIGNGSAFRNGRAFAAYLGLTPRQCSSGGKNILLGISKRGNRYLRTLLIHGARTIISWLVRGRASMKGSALSSWIIAIMERRGKNKAIVALAAKMARIAWSMLARGTKFDLQLASH